MKQPNSTAIGEIEESWRSSTVPEAWSSRMSADHAKIQRELGAVINDFDPFVVQTVRDSQTDIENTHLRQARLEHRRFLVERLIEGYLPLVDKDSHSGVNSCSGMEYENQQKDILHLNTTLVPFEKLKPVDRENLMSYVKDLQAVRSIAESSAPT